MAKNSKSEKEVRHCPLINKQCMQGDCGWNMSKLDNEHIGNYVWDKEHILPVELSEDGELVALFYGLVKKHYPSALDFAHKNRDLTCMRVFIERIQKGFNIEDKGYARDLCALIIIRMIETPGIMNQWDFEKYIFGTYIFSSKKLSWFVKLVIDGIYKEIKENES